VSRFDGCRCRYERRCHESAWCLGEVTVAEVCAAAQRRLAAAQGTSRDATQERNGGTQEESRDASRETNGGPAHASQHAAASDAREASAKSDADSDGRANERRRG
jgi:hypothetical protein